MQTSPPKRKQCLEVSGGRLTYQANHEMPGLEMQIYSRQGTHCMQGGGEVHYVSSCASGRITRVMLADICGSEETFKRLSCELRGGLIRSINSIWQNRVVWDISTKLRELAQPGGFGKASVATYFAPTRSFVMCNIGNPPPLVFRARERSWDVLHGETDASVSSSEAIEGVYGEDEYRHIKTKLEVDDVVVLYGNGFASSAFPGGAVVGHSKLIDALQDAPHADPDSRLVHLIGLIQDRCQPEEDNTIIVCRVTNTRVRLRDNLLAPLRLFRRPAVHTALT
jgi:sigma-B regulation protein RsbU (phosphoserine phosphatase)